jgi:lipid-A-disaccharide synthase
MLVAGEPSGDALASKLVEALREAEPDRSFECFGSAGPRMRGVGVEAVVRADELAIMGPVEIARAMPLFLKAFRTLKGLARERKPDVAVLVDFPEFNLKLAKSLKRQGILVVYYVSPQLWGWRKYRRRTIRDHVDLLLAILPFEKDWYAEYGIKNVQYIGSPLVNEVRPKLSREQFRKRYDIGGNDRVLALLPGSRHKEIVRILPPMLEAAALLYREDPELRFVIALAPGRSEAEIEQAMIVAKGSGMELPSEFVVVRDATHDALNASDAAAVASGTATLEAGILGTPMAIVYKTSGLNYRLVRPLIKIDHFGLINLIAGKRLAAEMIQDDLTPDALAAEMRRLLDPETNARVRNELKEATEKLGEGGASRRAARAILELADQQGDRRTSVPRRS